MNYRIDEHNCVHEVNADGSKGKTVECHDTPEDAQAHLGRLLGGAGSEAWTVNSGEGSGITSGGLKALGELCALFPIGADPELVRLQDMLRGLLGSAGSVNFVDPGDFHITAVYSTSADLEGAQAMSLDIPAFSVLVDGIGVFDTPDGYAIHATVRNQGDVAAMQRYFFGQIAPSAEDVSGFSLPENYQPHITLAYSPMPPMQPFAITPFSLSISRVELGTGLGEEPLKEGMLKAMSDSITCGASRSLPISTSNAAWDGQAAQDAIFEHAGGADFDPAKARPYFLFSVAGSKKRGDYHDPFVVFESGDPKVSRAGLRAAASMSPKTQGISDGERASARGVIEAYQKKFADAEKTMPAEILEKSVHFTDEGDLVIPVIGLPFKGPVEGNRDFVGDFYHPQTDPGPLKTAMAFYDHGRDGQYVDRELKALGLSDEQVAKLGDFGFGKRDIGVAERAELTPDGLIYNIIVNRRAKYRQALARAAREGLLSASSGSKTYIYDPKVPGKVDYASVYEITLSPTPMNPEARTLLAKAFLLEEDTVADEQQTEGKTITEKIQAQAAEVEKAAQETPTPAPESGDVLKAISDLTERIAALEQSVAPTVEKAVSSLKSDVETALPELRKMIEASLRQQIAEEVRKSKLELATEKGLGAQRIQQVQSQTPLPINPQQAAAIKNWPGSN